VGFVGLTGGHQPSRTKLDSVNGNPVTEAIQHVDAAPAGDSGNTPACCGNTSYGNPLTIQLQDERRTEDRVPVEEGKPPPDFELTSDAGETVKLSESVALASSSGRSFGG
jgi:hypothetical protein